MNNLFDIQNEIININKALKDKYNDLFKMDNAMFKEEVLSEIGNVKKLKKLSKEELENLGLLVGVDGSTNRVGGAYPHYIDLFQALAKPTKGEGIYLNKCFSPMTGLENEYDTNSKDKILAVIEIEAALEAAIKLNPKMIMMDGGLIRYQINNKKKYDELKEYCEENNIILFGVIKDIKTNIIARNFNQDESIYDRELLFGRLDEGEILEIYNQKNNKYIDGNLVSAFLRTSSSANAIGLDIIETQRKYLENVANLTYSLTPKSSRGVPLWLDIVDKEVKITDALIRSMLEEYLDRDIYERFFVSERDRRSL